MEPIGQASDTLDLKQMMDEGQHLLVDLGGVAAPETQRLLGSLVLNGIYHAAKRRQSRRRRDWFLIADEFGEFATPDIANSLDQLRKFGVHMVLAHQRLRQLEREDPDVLSAVMTNARIRVAFGGLVRPEAEQLARELYTGAVDGDRVKHVSMATKFRPVLDTFVVESESEGWGESESESEGESWSSSAGHSSGGNESYLSEYGTSTGPGYDDMVQRSHSESEQSSSTSGGSSGSSRGSSHSTSRSRSVVPITRHEEFTEGTSRTFYSLEEQWEKRVGELHGLPKRHALVRIYNGKVVHIVTPDVEVERVDGRSERYQAAVVAACPQIKPVAEVTRQIEARKARVAALADAAETAGRPFEVKSFRE